MSDSKPDRPDLRKIRRGPQPAPDRLVDPIDTRPQAQGPAEATGTQEPAGENRASRPTIQPAPLSPAVPVPPAPSVPIPRLQREVVVQLNSRVSARTKDILDLVKATTGQEIRVSLEQAVEERYGHFLPRE